MSQFSYLSISNNKVIRHVSIFTAVVYLPVLSITGIYRLVKYNV